MPRQDEFAQRRLLQQQLMAKALMGGSDFKAGDPPAKAWQPVVQQFGAAMAGHRLNREQKAEEEKRASALANVLSAFKGTPGTPATPDRPYTEQDVGSGVGPLNIGQSVPGTGTPATTGKRGSRDAVIESLISSGQPDFQKAGLAGLMEKPQRQWEDVKGPRGSMLQRDPSTGEMKQVVGPDNSGLLQQIFGGVAGKDDKTAPWSNIVDPKKKDEAKTRFGIEADKRLTSFGEDAGKSQNMVQALDRFVALNEKNATGGLYKIPGSQAVGTAFDSELSEMKSLQDLMTPQMRQGMPGAASDRDVAMFRGATVGLDKPKEANQNIATGLKAAHQNTIDRFNFMSEYIAAKGHDRGSETEWKRYLNANPIFDPSAPKGSYKLNEKRADYQTWFESGGKPIQGPGNIAPNRKPSGGLSAEEQSELEQLRKELNRGR